jgi:SNF2 family DNA or RNA helicase
VPECNVELAPYQREAVEWMLAREEPHVVTESETESERHTGSTSRQREMYYDRLTSKMRGGILADEMGLGKTVCCIALICESLKKCRSASGESSGSSSSVGGSHSEAMPRIKAPTLIITPLSILGQWEKEIREKTNLSVISYQGHSRRQIQNIMDFMGVDVVLSTYDTLRLKECKVTKGTTRGHDSSDNSHDEADEPSQDARAIFDQLNNSRQWHTAARRLSHSKKPATLSKLHQLMWHRLILDESHLITNPSCARAKAALVLKSKRRWCVTGTPIQNSGKDLSSLMTFLGMSHVAADLDYHEVLSRVMLRRLKSTVDVDSNEPIVQLPDKQEDVVELDFTSDLEKAYYTLLHRSTKRRVFEYLRKNGRGHGGGQFMHVFELLLRLRQCCDACSLVSDDPKREVQDGDGALLAEIGTLTRQEAALLERASRADPSPNANRFSTKIRRLLQELHAMKQNGERGLVVSQWTSFLDLIGEAIQAENAQNPSAERDGTVLRFCRLDGRMSAREREQAIASFQIEKRVDVLLVSIRTGGLGLNLTAASQVFIMEPSWNPSIESQAIDRAHRVGQTRRVRIVRFLMKHTIEERVVELQRKKRELATVTLGDGIASSQPTGTRTPSTKETALSHDELRGLFSQEAVESRGDGGHDDEGEPDDSMEAAIWDDLE